MHDVLRIRDDVGFFQAVRAVLAKSTTGERKTDEELDLAIRQIISKKDMRAAGARGEQLGLSEDELAFYDVTEFQCPTKFFTSKPEMTEIELCYFTHCFNNRPLVIWRV
jgi:hypothetical protein